MPDANKLPLELSGLQRPLTTRDNTKLFTRMNWKSLTTLAASGLGDSPCSCGTRSMITLSENIPTWPYCSWVKPDTARCCLGTQKQAQGCYLIVNLWKTAHCWESGMDTNVSSPAWYRQTPAINILVCVCICVCVWGECVLLVVFWKLKWWRADDLSLPCLCHSRPWQCSQPHTRWVTCPTVG